MLAFGVKAQGLAITEATDFTFSDNGTEKTLFEVLDNGQHVLLYFFNYQSEVSEEKAPIINGVYNSLGMNQEDVYLIGLDPANESILLNNWAVITDVKYPLIAKDKAYYISQTYGGQWGVMLPALILIAPNHDIILEEIWPITSTDQVVGIINDNLADGDEGEDPETPVDPEIPVDPETPVGLAIPTNVVATATSETTIVLTWDAVDGATEYNIYTPASFDSNVLGLTETTYTFEGLTAGTNYCFEVSAASATDESDTAEACATTPDEGDDDDDPEYPEPTTVPDAPVINVYAENSELIVIEWEAVETAIFYYVYYNGNLVGDGRVMGTEVEIKVYPETEYCFTVTAVNTVGESEHSNEACATTPAEEGEEDDEENPFEPDGNIEFVENNFTICPNPASSEVKISSAMNGEANVIIYDITGRCVKDVRVDNISNATINVSDINKGVYFINVNGKVEKLIIK